MEIFDIVDENGIPTGETVDRLTAHENGIRHRTAHMWVIRENEGKTQVLLQKRSRNKDSFPGRFDTSSAGHIRAGDEPIESAIRELDEELGIKASEKDLEFIGTFIVRFDKEFHGKMFKDNEIAFVFICRKNVNKDELRLQEEEVEQVEWFDLDYVYAECKKHNQFFCVPVKGLEVLINYIVEKQKAMV